MDLETLPLISADSHVEEPSTLWRENLPASMVEFLPRELSPDSPEYHAATQFAERIGIEDASGAKAVTDAAAAAGADGLDGLRALTVDLERRFEVMRDDGIAGECIYPTTGLYVWNTPDRAVGEACCRLYNEWIHDRLESRSPRFRCAGMVPTWDIEGAVAEVERIADLGLAAAMLPVVGTPEYNHPDWKPLWRAIEETGLPVAMHQGTGHDMLFYRGPGSAVSNLLSTQSMAPRTVSLLATSGVLAEFPGLHFVFVETNAGWLSWTMNTVDYYYDAFQEYEGWVRPVLPEKPSFYMARQIHGTFQIDPVAITNIGNTGIEPLLWGSDFPHAEGTYPNSRKVVIELFKDVDIAAVAEIVAGTAARLFRFDPEVLVTPV
ncbi:MAG: amidohydrolase [Deltaproteobacteria bacterium]|jgi:predicted TIM-barrel fold metal-dependent hydrolase|nr:amidohydrolase [Deltaproteobacteria bacterium]